MRRRLPTWMLCLPAAGWSLVPIGAAVAQDEPPVNFEDHIRPIIDEYCLGCHRGSRARNGLKLDSATGIFEGGSSGAAIVPGDPDGSLLYQVIARTREPYMPYEDDPLPAAGLRIR